MVVVVEGNEGKYLFLEVGSQCHHTVIKIGSVWCGYVALWGKD